MHKTCWYTTIHPLRVGALVGSGGKADLARLVRFGFHFGAAFQIRDDVLNLGAMNVHMARRSSAICMKESARFPLFIC